MRGRAFRNVRIGAKSLLLHRLRSLLTMLGVVFGVAAVIAMLAVGEGASRDALAELGKLGSRNIVLRSQKAVDDEASGTVRKRMDIYGLTYDDELRIRESFTQVRRTVPVKELRKRGYLGGRNLELLVVGTTPEPRADHGAAPRVTGGPARAGAGSQFGVRPSTSSSTSPSPEASAPATVNTSAWFTRPKSSCRA